MLLFILVKRLCKFDLYRIRFSSTGSTFNSSKMSPFFCGQEGFTRLSWKMSPRLMSIVQLWQWTPKPHTTQSLFLPSYKPALQLKVYFMFSHTTVGGTIWLLVLHLLQLSWNRSDIRPKWERWNVPLSRWYTRYAVYSFFVTLPLAFTPSTVYKQTTTLPYAVPLWFCGLFVSVASPFNRSLAISPTIREETSRHINLELRSSGILHTVQW